MKNKNAVEVLSKRASETITDDVNLLVTGYEKEPLLRLLVQLLPFGSFADSTISSKATQLHRERVIALLQTVVTNLSDLEKRSLDLNFLQSEDFVEVLETSLRVVARTAKRTKTGARPAILQFLSLHVTA